MATLIQPVRSGAELIAEIESTRPAPGRVAIWWLGQSGFLIKSRGGLLVIDPYLSESLTRKYAGTGRDHVRMTAPPLRGEDLPVVQLALASHKHSDHLDPDTMVELTRRSRCPLGLPAPLLDHARGLGIPGSSLVGLIAGQVLEAAGFRVRAVPSAHEGLDTDAQGRHLYLGFVVEMDGLRLYHSGDGLFYDGLDGQLGASPFDAMFLPINGRDPTRGVPGNMSAAEAIDLASRLRPRFVVPHHYDMFTFNTAPVGDFLREARRLPPGVTPRALRCGERWEIGL